MLTSLGGREVLRQSDRETVQFAAYLTKPIKPSQLYNTFVAIFGEQSEGPQPAAAPTKSLFDGEMARRHPLHILLAEDHPTNQKLALRLLERLGYRADVAANGLEVLAAIERQHYDVILMDMQMPEMDGLEATRTIRRREAEAGSPRLSIVAMTANAMQGDRELCVAAGMDDYVSKPIRVGELVDALEKIQGHKSGDGAGQDDHDGQAPQEDGPWETPPPAGQATGKDGAVLDPSALENLLELIGDEPEILAEMIDSYLETAPPLLAQLNQSLASGDAAAFRLAAHTLKSGSADFGATALSKLCEQLEEMGKAGTLAGAEPLVARAEAFFDEATIALNELRQE
jgi:CheY-like chemotaxis protein